MGISIITPSIRPEYLHITQECLENQTNQNFEWLVDIGLRNRGFTLPTDWNNLLRRAKGDIIFIVQDCISFSNDTVQNILTLDYDKKAYTFPVSKDGVWDWRKSEPKKLTPNEWEIDMGAAPRSLFYDVGGFDEEFCNGWSWENVEIAWRAEAAGYAFYSSHAAEGNGIDHDAIRKHPFRETLEKNGWRANQTMEKARRGNYKMPYLF